LLVGHEADGEFAFNGFCPLTLVLHNGLLLLGDVVLGSVKWERHYSAFIDADARASFQAALPREVVQRRNKSRTAAPGARVAARAVERRPSP
jgi:hypothetical protein